MRRAMDSSTVVFASVLAIVALAGCGDKMAVPSTPITGLPESHMLEPGAIPAGESRTVRDADGVRTVVTCPAGGEACVVTVGPDGAAQSTGGTPTVTTYTAIEGLPAGHDLATGTIPVGESRTVRDADGMRTVVTCPVGGEDCVITVGSDGAAESTGGKPTVTTIFYTIIEGLPAGHRLATGTIPAGESRTVRDANGVRTVVTCPAGGEACVITVGSGGAAESTGGTPTVTTISYTTIEGLPAGHRLATGTIPAGESRTVRDANGVRTVVTCPADGEACVITVGSDGAAESTGGTPTVTTISYTTIEGLPAGHDLATGTIPAGESRTIRDVDGVRTVVTCPARGEACVITVGSDGAAESTGGTPTVTTISYTTIEGLPAGHRLATGTIPAGESRTVRDVDGVRTVVTCPADGEACVVTVGSDGAAESTGGTPTVTTISYMAIEGLPEGHSLATGTIPAGESRTVRDADGMRTVVTCPARGEACVITVGSDGAAESTGGTPTVATISYTTIEGLPAGHRLATGTIPAGETRTVRDANGVRTVVTCPAGGETCVVTVGSDGAAESTGGTLTVATISYMAIEGLPEGHSLATGTTPAGESRTVWDADGMRTVVTCPVGGEDCVVTVGSDGAAESTGGTPTVATISYMAIEGLPEGHSLTTGTIPAGETRTVWDAGSVRTDVTCPVGGEDCVVTVAEDGAAESTGGTPTVATYTTIEGLPEGHPLTVGTTIPAGEKKSTEYSMGRGSNVVCPAGGEDCFVAWVSNGAAEFTGGMPTLTVVNNQMVWQANNGPEGTSNGAHARRFEGLLLSSGTRNQMFEYAFPGLAQRSSGSGSNVHATTTATFPKATPTTSWTRGTAPTLGLSVVGTGSGSFSLVEDSTVPSLGAGWNGVALSKETIPTARTGRAVIYSNIERPVSGTPDGYYMTFGSWLVMPVASSAASSQYDWGLFTDGNAASRLTRAQVNALTGTATYEGPATGLHIKARYSGSTLRSAAVGSFTATATVNANFGSAGSVGGFGGSVTNFMENGESLGDWTVSLNNMDFTFPSNRTLFLGRTGGTAGTRSLSGTWSLQILSDGTGAGYAVGTFSASTAANAYDALRIGGVFGVERQD